MLQILAAFARSYAPYIMLPATMVIGAVGYNLEWWMRFIAGFLVFTYLNEEGQGRVL